MIHKLESLGLSRRMAALALPQVLAALVAMAPALLKESAIAHSFGVGAPVDAYVVAWLLPSMAATQLALAANASFTRRYVQARQGGDPAELGRTTSAGVVSVASALGVIALFLFAFAGSITRALAPGLEPATFLDAVRMLRILAPATVLYGTAGVLCTIAAASGRPLAASLAPAAMPVCVGLFSWYFARALGASALAWGALAGAACELGIVLVWTKGLGLWRWPSAGHFVAIRGLSGEAAWALTGNLLIGAINVYDVFTLSALPTGGLAAFRYANRLIMVPITAADAVLSYIAYPRLCALAPRMARGWAMRGLVVLALVGAPGVLIAYRLAPVVVGVLLRHGEFDRAAAASVVSVLEVFSIYFVMDIAAIGMCRYFAAVGRNRVAAAAAAVGLGVKLLLNKPLGQAYGPAGVAWATCCEYMILVLILAIMIQRGRETTAAAQPPALGAALPPGA